MVKTGVQDETTEQILAALRNPKYRLRTAKGIAAETKIEPAEVRRILESLQSEVVKPNLITPAGDQLYGLRERIIGTSSFMDSLSASFSNRVL